MVLLPASMSLRIHVCSLSDAHKPKTSSRARLASVFALSTPSILLKSDDDGKLSKSTKKIGSRSNSIVRGASNSRHIVGVIGGVSLESTFKFLKKLDEEDSFPFVVCYDSGLKKGLVVHERDSSRRDSFEFDDRVAVDNLRKKRIYLEECGVGCIVMPCNVFHSFYDEVCEGCSGSFIHMGECVARELKGANLRPVEAGGSLRIGILSSNPSLSADVYQAKLLEQGFDVVLPDRATIEHTIIPAIKAIARKDIEGAQTLLRIALQVLLVRAVNTVIIASDELWDILPTEDPLLKRCIDPLAVLARSTIRWARSVNQCT